MNFDELSRLEYEFLEHVGTKRHSGRYPWGSGDNPYQHDVNFLKFVRDSRKQGMRDVDIAKGMNMNTAQMRKRISLANAEMKRYETTLALKLRDKGMSTSAIARRMGKNESTVRLLLNPVMQERRNETRKNADVLKEAVDSRNYIDVGAGVEQYLGISGTRLKNAIQYLQNDGYVLFNNVKFEQLGTGKDTTLKVLCKPGTEFKDVVANKGKITPPFDFYSEDRKTLTPKEPPVSIDPDRVNVRYAEEGGAEKDGVIELRRGVPDISLGDAKYAQVRIAVGGTHYLKGMAVYSDNLPDGCDIMFNTNKHLGTPMINSDPDGKSVLKPMKNDPDNPFGATIREADKLIRCQRHYIGEDGKKHLSALNVVSEEGTWDTWSRNLPSQFLSKQNPSLAKRQLDESYSLAKEELDDISKLTNPTVRAKLLNEFAGKCDSDATHLQAAALPRQAAKVILPVPQLKDTDIYAPSYRDGEKVALVRFPHGGIFEIPTLTVNNKQKDARSLLGNAVDAVGINHKVAEQLSGADFDGDTVLVIPISNVKIKTAQPLEGLKNFDPKESYPAYKGMKLMTKREKGIEMGKASNLITDMTIKGATMDEICRAVKHSMVVIDAEKHKLNYKQSEIDNGIAELRAKYQNGPNGGTSTLLSRSTSEVRIPQRKEIIAKSKMTPEQLKDWEAGKLVYENTGNTYSKKRVDKDGNVIWDNKPKMDKVSKMALTDDAYTLVSGGSKANTTRIESVYADYANNMKALAIEARRRARHEADVPYNPSARIAYANEVRDLNSALNIAKRNAPLERRAQLIASMNYKAKLRDNPDMDDEHRKRLKGQELDYARKVIGAKKTAISITPRQWEAINAGAITKSKLKEIIDNVESDKLKAMATPRTKTGLSPARMQRAKTMLAAGHTQADVADTLGVSVSTLMNALNP